MVLPKVKSFTMLIFFNKSIGLSVISELIVFLDITSSICKEKSLRQGQKLSKRMWIKQFFSRIFHNTKFQKKKSLILCDLRQKQLFNFQSKLVKNLLIEKKWPSLTFEYKLHILKNLHLYYKYMTYKTLKDLWGHASLNKDVHI